MPSGEKGSEPGPAALENGSRVWYNMLRESIEEEFLYEIRYWRIRAGFIRISASVMKAADA